MSLLHTFRGTSLSDLCSRIDLLFCACRANM
nr:MAG TPA: hypothetical protein [Caudoviricetes sp.]DAL37057.1 MAG TPA_asm: hypothetical protein [Caudoviricetes sp.]